MKSFKIKNVKNNKRKKLLEIETVKGEFSLPYSKLMNPPTKLNPIIDVFVDKELSKLAVTYELQSGEIDSIPLDAFLDFNRNPDYLRALEIHRLTVKANDLVKESGMSKREIVRRMNTSLSQLSRILDTANQTKTFDQLFKLFNILGAHVKINIDEVA